MIKSNPRFKGYLEAAAKTCAGPFDYEELHEVIQNSRDAKGQVRKILPSAPTVKSLLMRATWARPIGERMVTVGNNSPRSRTIYIYDEAWGEERKAMRLKGVEA